MILRIINNSDGRVSDLDTDVNDKKQEAVKNCLISYASLSGHYAENDSFCCIPSSSNVIMKLAFATGERY